MKPVPRSYGVSGELKPVKPNSYGVVNMVSVLLSVADPSAPMSLLQRQLRLEAEVGIEQSQKIFQNPLLRNYHPTTRGEQPHN